MTGKHVDILATVVVVVLCLGGCAGGNRLISNRGGHVESGELVLGDIPQRPEPGEYIIGHGDVLDVTFFYNSELNQVDLKVRPDGKISLPYVGDVDVAGKQVSAVDSALEARYAEVLVKPVVTVAVRSYSPDVVYVLGETKVSGGYPYARGMTLLDILALGGGFAKSSKKTGVVVIRRVASDHIVGIQVNVKELLEGHRFDLDVPLQPFDIVYVPKSALSTAQDFVLALNDILSTPADLYLKGWSVANVKILYDFYRRQGQTLPVR
jgi:polysaccharide export outer membrane protein